MTGIPETPGDVLDSKCFNKSSTSSLFISVKSKLEDIFETLFMFWNDLEIKWRQSVSSIEISGENDEKCELNAFVISQVSVRRALLTNTDSGL